MEKIQILIEPKVKIFKRLNKPKAITTSLKNTEISLKVTNQSRFLIDNLILEGIRVLRTDIGYENTFSHEFKLSNLRPNKSQSTERFKVFFPNPGLSWLDVKVKANSSYEIETLQRTLEGAIGSGSGNRAPYLCRSPIGVVDALSRKVTYYTIVILIATLVMVIQNFF